MSTWSVSTSPTGFSSMTAGDAKRYITRIIGAKDNPDEFGAGDALRVTIDELNRHRWEFLTVRGSDIPLVADQATYTLATPFKDHLSLMISGTVSGDVNRSLTYVPRGSWDPLVENASVGGTWFYTNFNQGLSGTVELLDAPSAAGTMEIRYYRPIAIPTSDDSLLDVPEGPLEAALLKRAQYWIGLWHGIRSERLAQLQREAHLSIREAKGDDMNPADFRAQWIPGRMWGRRPINVNSTWPYIRGW